MIERSDDAYGPSTYGDRIAGVYDEMYRRSCVRPERRGDGRTSWRRSPARGRRSSWGSGPARRRSRSPRQAPTSTASTRRRRWSSGLRSEAGRRGDPGHDRLTSASSRSIRRSSASTSRSTRSSGSHPGRQVTCFRTVARHLTPDGVFVMEAFVSGSRPIRPRPARVGDAGRPGRVSLDVSKHDPVAQRERHQHV